MIKCKGLSRKFGRFTAVKPLDFDIPKGQVVGFIGPNGAGKTTTMRMLTGYLPPTSGSASIDGLDIFDDNTKVKKKVGYLPEAPPLYPELTIGQYLEFVGTLRGLPQSDLSKRIGEVMAQIGLSGWENKPIHTLSKGYRQRVGMAQAILHKPSVLILDEPTSGLDPTQVAGIRTFLKDLAAERTVILSTHILSEVEKLCDRVLFIKEGALIADTGIHQLDQILDEGYLSLGISDSNEGFIPALERLECVNKLTVVENNDRDVLLRVGLKLTEKATLMSWLHQKNIKVNEAHYHQPSLEDVFLSLVKEEN